MPINDPYDRSGQYADGHRGEKLGNYSTMEPDERDYAIATMAAEGYTDGPRGYAGILDTMENRRAGINAFGGKGAHGYFSTMDQHGLPRSTMQDITTAKNTKGISEFNAWDKNQPNAFGTANRALQGNPRPGREQSWYDQALTVYDDYYDGTQPYKGITNNSTFYQADYVQGKKAGAFQDGIASRRAQELGRPASVKIDTHVFTGPGFGRQTPDWSKFEGWQIPGWDLEFEDEPVPQKQGLWDDVMVDWASVPARPRTAAVPLEEPIPEALQKPGAVDLGGPDGYGGYGAAYGQPGTGSLASLGLPDQLSFAEEPSVAEGSGWGGPDGWGGYGDAYGQPGTGSVASLGDLSFDGGPGDAGGSWGGADGYGGYGDAYGGPDSGGLGGMGDVGFSGDDSDDSW